MKMHSDFHMAQGEKETSYIKNSRLQRKALFETKQVLEKALREVFNVVLPENLVVSDLGCSSGENTLIFISGVINATRSLPLGLQFFLNDLPGNDFNHIFQSLELFRKSIAEDHKEETLPPFYVAGLPGSYYTRLFPCQSVHLFHSSYSLHWLSRLPGGLEGNKGNIYITMTTPLSVVERYQEKFQKDFMLFLQLRNEELVFGGQMVLAFLGRKEDNVYNGNLNYLLELLAQSLWSLVDKGLVEKEKVNSFNLPIYGASVSEVRAVIKQSGLFHINQIKLFESNWDPYDDDLLDDVVQDNIRSGVNIARSVRAVMETLLASHFGESVLEALFNEYACKVAKHLKWYKTKYSVIVLSLRKRNLDD